MGEEQKSFFLWKSVNRSDAASHETSLLNDIRINLNRSIVTQTLDWLSLSL